MRKVNKLLSVVLAAAMLVMCVAMTACSKDGASSTAGDASSTGEAASKGDATGELTELVIGGVAPLTGQYANYGKPNSNGAMLAAKEINAAGGVNGFQLNVQFQDSQGDPDTAVAAYGKLMDQGMKVSLGGTLSGETASIVAAAQEDGLLVLTPTGSAKSCIEGNDAAFRVCFNDPQQGSASADFIKDHTLGAKVAVFYQSDIDYSKGLYDTFVAEAKNQGLEIVATETFTKGTSTDFTTQINAIKDSGADLVFIPIYAAEAATFLTQARGKLADDMFYFGCDGLDGILGKVDKPETAENVLMLTPFAADDTTEKVAKFVDAFKAEYDGMVPDQFGADGYDAVYAIAAAIKEANLTPDDLKNTEDFNARIVAALTKITVDGVTGKMTWTADGETQKAAKAMIIKNGVATLYQ